MGLFNKKKEDTTNNLKILGERIVFQDSQTNFYYPRYYTRIYYNPLDIHFLPKLSTIGFDIEKVQNDMVGVVLPPHWTHIRIDEETEIIIDVFGRTRLKINTKQRKSQLLRRFNFGIEIIQGDIASQSVKCYFTDCDRIVTGINITNEQYEEFWELSGKSQEKMIEICIEECANILKNNFPEWEDETAYWSL